MIYNQGLQIPVLGCPIPFTRDKRGDYYPLMDRYIQKLTKRVFFVQVRLSEELYEGGQISLVMKESMTRRRLSSVAFTKWELSEGYYFAMALASLPANETCVYFEITNGAALLADSDHMLAMPNDTSPLVEIEYSHHENDFNTIFRGFMLFNNAQGPVGDCYLAKPGDAMPLFIKGFPGVATVVATNLSTSQSRTTSVPSAAVSASIVLTGWVGTDTRIQVWKSSTASGSPYATLTMEYQDGVWTNGLTPFVLTVEGGMKPSDMEVRDNLEEYDEQDFTTKNIFSFPYTVEKVTFGGQIGVPAPIYNRLGHIFACSRIALNGEKYSRVNGATMEKEPVGTTGFMFASIDVQNVSEFDDEYPQSGQGGGGGGGETSIEIVRLNSALPLTDNNVLSSLRTVWEIENRIPNFIYDGLDSTNGSIALSANQGRILAESLDTVGGVVADMYTWWSQARNWWKWDEANGAIYSEHNVYSTKGVSAYGLDPSGGGGGGASTLAELLDVNLSDPVNRDFLMFNGTHWVNVPESSIVPDLSPYATRSWVTSNFASINHTHQISQIVGLQSALDGKFDSPTGTTAQYIRGDGSLASLTTSAVPEGSRLYYTNARVKAYADTLYAPLSHVGATGNAHGVATTSVAGFMSAADKEKLNGIAAGATNLHLGETSSTAYRGDRGAVAYNHSQITNANPHNTWFAQLLEKPTTIAGYGITDAVTVGQFNNHRNNVNAEKHLTQAQVTYLNNLMSWFKWDGDNDAVYLEHNFYSTKGISSYGLGPSGGGGGASSLAELTDVQITTLAPNQLLRYNGTHWVNVPQSAIIPEFMVNVTGSGNALTDLEYSNGVFTATKGGSFKPNSYVPTWAEITGKPSWIGASKPTYAFSEITGTASVAQIPDLPASKITSGVLNIARIPTGATGSTVALGDDSRILHGETAYGWGNHAGRYLPLSGGTVTGLIRSTTANVEAAFYKTSSTGTAVLRIGAVTHDKGLGLGDTGDLIFGDWSDVSTLSKSWNKVYHTGNFNAFGDGRYVTLATNQTISGAKNFTQAVTVGRLIISSTGGVKHIEFTQPNFNYVTAPVGGNISFVPNGKDANATTSNLVIETHNVRPGATNAYNLGTSSSRWANVYANIINVASTTLVSNLNADMVDGYHHDNFSKEISLKNTAAQPAAGGYFLIRLKPTPSQMFSLTIGVYQGYRRYDLTVATYNYYNAANPWYLAGTKLSLENSSEDSVDVILGYFSTSDLYIAIPRLAYAGVKVSNIINGFGRNTDWTKNISIEEYASESALPGTIYSQQTVYRSWLRNETVESATKLATARTFSITGAATASAVSFNGTANVALDVTSLTANNLTGTIPSSVLGNSTVFIGTTAVPLNRASGILALAGIRSLAADQGVYIRNETGHTVINSTSSSGNIYFSIGQSAGVGNRMIINYNGNVGIGVDSPTQKLHVVGNILGTNLIQSPNALFTTQAQSPKFNLGNGWTIEAAGSELHFKLNGVLKSKMTEDGSFVAVAEVTAFG